MTDIFFSYSSRDRERVRAVHAALAAQGFDIFWDQEIPAGTDWDRWIRQHLQAAKCAIVFWSLNSVSSDNVRHEAEIAKRQGKLIPVLLEALTVDQFPMGLYNVQGATLAAWDGDEQHDGWLELKRELESRLFKLTPLWVQRRIDALDAELIAERARREGAERRDQTLRNQIAKEAQAQQTLMRERDLALEEISALKALAEHANAEIGVEERSQQVSALEGERRQLAAELQHARQKIGALERMLAESSAARNSSKDGRPEHSTQTTEPRREEEAVSVPQAREIKAAKGVQSDTGIFMIFIVGAILLAVLLLFLVGAFTR